MNLLKCISVNNHIFVYVRSIALGSTSQQMLSLHVFTLIKPFLSSEPLSNHSGSSSDNVYVASEADELIGFIEDHSQYVEAMFHNTYLYNILNRWPEFDNVPSILKQH